MIRRPGPRRANRSAALAAVFLVLAGAVSAQAGTGTAGGSAASPSQSQLAKPAAPPTAVVTPTVSKDETVYAILDPTGAVKSVIVSAWLHSTKPGAEIKDKSNLTAIENVKGYEIPRRVGDNLIWRLDGSDLYYRGKSSKSLPLSVSVKYWLDGKAIEPSALAGRSGLVRIRVEVKNLAGADRVIDGVKRRIYAPMFALVGLDLPSVGFKDVQVTNGKLLTDGQNNIAVGLLIPGLKDSIVAAGGFGPGGIDLTPIGIKDIPLPDAFEFTAKVDKFRLGSIFVAATPDFPDIGGPNTVGQLDDALAQFQQLADASKAIKEGSAALAQGAGQLKAAVVGAVDSLKPAVAQNQLAIGTMQDFIVNDQMIAAARELLQAGDGLDAATPALVEVLNRALDKQNQAALQAIIADAKKIDAKELLGAPTASSVISEDGLANIASMLSASDALYKGMDSKRLEAAATFAAGARQLFDVLGAFDTMAGNYNPADGQALQALGGQKGDFERFGAQYAQVSSLDGAGAARSLQERNAADASFLGASAFMDQGGAALMEKLASGAALTDAERVSLASLLGAVQAERNAIKKTAPALAPLPAALPVLSDGARLANGARPGVQAAASLASTVVGGLNQAKDNKKKYDEAIAAGRKILDPTMVGVITKTVPKLLEAKKAYEKNKPVISLAQTFLAVKLKSGSFKSQIALIDDIQKNLTTLGPSITLLQDTLSKPEFASLINPGPGSPTLQALLKDLSLLRPLMLVSREAVKPENVKQLRALAAQLPTLGKSVEDLVNGATLLSDKLQELAAGTKQFDEDGIQKISSVVVDKAKFLRGFLKVKDELSNLSREYQSFSGAPDNADTSLKFIFKTDEIK